jgi:hypothetical protein
LNKVDLPTFGRPMIATSGELIVDTMITNGIYLGEVMKFELAQAISVLQQSPYTLLRMLGDLDEVWTKSSGKADDWAPYDVIGHLIHGEETDWIQRAEIILAQGTSTRFEPFDRLAHLKASRKKGLADLLTEFAHVRSANLERLQNMWITPEQLELEGVHPEFGTVTLRQLLATWVVHDLNHISQITRYMARQYGDAVGPWNAYLSILQK